MCLYHVYLIWLLILLDWKLSSCYLFFTCLGVWGSFIPHLFFSLDLLGIFIYIYMSIPHLFLEIRYAAALLDYHSGWRHMYTIASLAFLKFIFNCYCRAWTSSQESYDSLPFLPSRLTCNSCCYTFSFSACSLARFSCCKNVPEMKWPVVCVNASAVDGRLGNPTSGAAAYLWLLQCLGGDVADLILSPHSPFLHTLTKSIRFQHELWRGKLWYMWCTCLWSQQLGNRHRWVPVSSKPV